jgi:hypothetical protein
MDMGLKDVSIKEIKHPKATKTQLQKARLERFFSPSALYTFSKC